MVRGLMVLLVCAATALAANKPQLDLSGTWKLDPVRSKFKTAAEAVSKVVITQGEKQLRFDYFAGDKSLGSDVFATNGVERPRYTSHVEQAFSRLRFEKRGITIITRGVLDVEGTQTYTETETWMLSTDGNTLTHDTNDGNIFVFAKESSSGGPAQ